MSGAGRSLGVSERCATCKEPFGYDADWEEPPSRNDGHVEVVWNPEQPERAIAKKRYYCSPQCLVEDVENTPFSPPEVGE